MYDGDEHYEFTAFQYIHQNPFQAKLLSNLENWPYSSFLDYAGLRSGTICDKELAFKLIGFDKDNFVIESYQEIRENLLPKLFYRIDRGCIFLAAKQDYLPVILYVM